MRVVRCCEALQWQLQTLLCKKHHPSDVQVCSKCRLWQVTLRWGDPRGI